MNWFVELTGFDESEQAVRSSLTIDGDVLRSSVNGRSMHCGTLTTPSLAELRRTRPAREGPVSVREIVADARALHLDPANAGAVFQVASQFNLLEMPGPSVTPERGVTGYWNDRTQGPACAVACGAGTIQRNWFASVGDQIGQTAERQIDCAANLGAALGGGPDGRDLWTMQNGYLFATAGGLDRVEDVVAGCSVDERDELLGHLRIGLQSDTEVTFGTAAGTAGHLVSQAYCSAVPVGYSDQPAGRWEPLARLVLDATYEATLSAAAIAAESTGNRSVFLTLVGGGVFGNRTEWIVDAIRRAVACHEGADLDVVLVSYGAPKPELRGLLTER
ncbi:hypothetical protein [Ilumatobacter nonamiensis]|uniref:hypothetical protein n=1 Tax=Ilumatobacter nonamiensis TaxID=467093 RepID=UPI00034BE2E8|nr:hypothetical protein [Ilumatobacter nonamiensis]